MTMLGSGRLVIWFEVDSPEIIPEHEHWHAHEHMYERLGIPGFLRGRRAVSASPPRKYFVTYEVESFEVLKSAPYRKCLENPTPWTQKMMPRQRNIVRSLCRAGASYGSGIGQVIGTIRFAPAPGKENTLRGWLNQTALPQLPAKAGMVGAHFLEAIKQTGQPPTNEQKLRGASDGEADWVLLVEGYDAAAVNGVLRKELHADELARHGAAAGAITDAFVHDFALTAQDIEKKG
jgi:hypothetical protein